MKLIHDSIPCLLLHLLLVAELFVHSSSRPTNSPPPCGLFRPMLHQVDRLKNFSTKLHGLEDEVHVNLKDMGNQLDGLPHIKYTAATISSLKMNETLSQLFEYTQSFRLHVDWLKTVKENLTLPSQIVEGARSHLLTLSNLVNTSLHQINEEVPSSPSLSLPVVSTAFDMLKFSLEISNQLQVFCNWSKTVLGRLQRSHCRTH